LNHAALDARTKIPGHVGRGIRLGVGAKGVRYPYLFTAGGPTHVHGGRGRGAAVFISFSGKSLAGGPEGQHTHRLSYFILRQSGRGLVGPASGITGPSPEQRKGFSSWRTVRRARPPGCGDGRAKVLDHIRRSAIIPTSLIAHLFGRSHGGWAMRDIEKTILARSTSARSWAPGLGFLGSTDITRRGAGSARWEGYYTMPFAGVFGSDTITVCWTKSRDHVREGRQTARLSV